MPALSDKAIRERLHHIHLVQHAFLWMTGPRSAQLELKQLEDFAGMAHLKVYARQFHTQVAEVMKNLSPAKMEEMVDAPWFNKPTSISRRHAFTQAAMHSHYHRGQNATRLRELGGVPPLTDFIIWLRDGQPGARWE